MKVLVAGALLGALLLAACGESTEEVYRRGYDDGMDELCGMIAHYAPRAYDEVRRENLC